MSRIAAGAGAFAAMACLAASAIAQAPELRRSPGSSELRLPIVVERGPEGKPAVVTARILWNPEGAARSNLETLQFRFLGPAAGSAAGAGPQFWASALAAAMAWQETWRGAMFDVLEAPAQLGSETACSLAIGLMATAGGAPYPADLVVVAGLNPDNSLGPVNDLPGCLQAVAGAGLRRVIIAVNQRIVATEDGRLLNAANIAAGLKLEILVAQDLMEATQIALARALPPEPRLDVEPRYRSGIFNALAAECEAEFNRLAEDMKAWPAMDSLPVAERPIWAEVRRDFEAGGDAFRAGRVYAARLLLAKAAAGSVAFSQWKERENNPDIKAWDGAVNEVRKKIIDAMYRPGFDKGELRSALVLSEQAEWLYGIDARMEGAQVLARQAFAPRSDASAGQRQYARDALFAAWRGGAFLVENPMNFRSLYTALGTDGEFPVFDRATLWLPQLMPAHLARAEDLALGLRRYANRFSGVLVFDPRFAAFSLMARRSKEEWEDMRGKLEKIQRPDAGPAGLRRVGFRPGAAYQPPRPAIPKAPVDELSDAARCLMWVNGYCETALLEQKYIRLGGEFDEVTQRWTLANEAILQSLLQSADRAARRGIALADDIGMESDMLAMIYERGTFLRYTKDDSLRLEGLKQLWRCGLLGILAWQFGSTPKAAVTVVQGPEPPAPAALPAIPVQGTPQVPEAAPPVPAPAPEPQPMAPVEPPPAPVPAQPPRAVPVAAPVAPVAVPVVPAGAEVPQAMPAEPVAPAAQPVLPAEIVTNAPPAAPQQLPQQPPVRKPRRQPTFFRR